MSSEFDQGAMGAPEQDVPALRTFRVLRYKPGTDNKELETIDVPAHSLQFAGPVLQLVTFMVLEGQPGGVSKRGFFGWIDYEDITPEPSNLVHPGSARFDN